MVLIPAGKFTYGELQGDGDTIRMHREYLPAFYIYKYEVTNKQFAEFVLATGYQAEGNWERYYTKEKENHPVVGVSFNDALHYAKWAGVRLPTDLEWEKAARGPDGRIYPWGNSWNPKNANWGDRGKDDGFNGTAPVGSYPKGASFYGVMDMAGNVWEMCRIAPGPNTLTNFKIIRGSSWQGKKYHLRSSYRRIISANTFDEVTGFRCAKDYK
jgi:sulfatase modifying factor 1